MRLGRVLRQAILLRADFRVNLACLQYQSITINVRIGQYLSWGFSLEFRRVKADGLNLIG